MKNSSTNIMRLAVMLLLVFALSGCAVGGRRLNSTTTPDLSQPQQNQPTTSPGDTSITPGAVENTTPATEVVSPDASSDAQAEDLLNLINTLDAANQAGDPLDDLP
jgi:cytoskeletal protein RodZ